MQILASWTSLSFPFCLNCSPFSLDLSLPICEARQLNQVRGGSETLEEVENILEAWVFSGSQTLGSAPSSIPHLADQGHLGFCTFLLLWGLQGPQWPSFRPQALTFQVLAQVAE